MANLYIAVTEENAMLVDKDLFSSEESGCFKFLFLIAQRKMTKKYNSLGLRA